MGTAPLYSRMGEDDAIRWESVAHTHSQAVLREIPNLVAINGAVEVDLLGQADPPRRFVRAREEP